MALEEHDLLAGQSASYLRTKLISEIKEFIRSLEMKMPLDELTRKRDRIRLLFQLLSTKENVEFDQILGNYFPNLMGRNLPGNMYREGI